MRALRHSRGPARAAALVLALMACLLWATPARADYSINKVDIDATLSSDGSLAVDETRTFAFHGSYHGVYWNIPEGTYEGRSVTPTGVTAGEVVDGQRVAFAQSDSGANGTYQLTDNGSYLQVKVYSAHEDESARFWVSYTDANLATRWADTSELYWKFVSDGWDVESQNVTCTIHLPVPAGQAVQAGQNVRAWGHGPLDGSVSFTDDGVIYTAPGVGTDEYAEARVTFPAEWLSAAAPSGEPRLDAILSQEQQWAGEANAQRDRARALAVAIVAVFAAAAVGSVVAAVLVRRAYHRAHRPQFQDRYFRDVPSADHPAVLAALLNDGKATPEGFTASLMRLTDERVVTLEEANSATKGAFGRRKEHHDYRIARAGELGEQPSGDRARSGARDVDQATLDFLFGTVRGRASQPRAEGGRDAILFSDLEHVAKEHPRAYAEGYDTWKGTVEGTCLERGFLTDARPTHGWLLRLLEALDVALCVLLVVWAGGGVVPMAALGLAPVLAAVAVACGRVAKGLRQTSPEADELTAKLVALRRWLREFTHLEEAVPRDVVLWDRLLVMAVALGVSDEVIDQLKVAAPEVLEDPYMASVYGWWYLGSPYGMAAPVHAVADVAKAAHSVSNAALASSSMSSGMGGGGGFSGGGGGGFGGGGGGGAF